MKALIYTAGSAGDTYPFIGIGKTLADRGHHVELFANEAFADIIKGAGLSFVQAGDAGEFHAAINDPDLWDRRRGFEAAVRPFIGHMREWVALIESHLDDGSVVVGSTLGFPARILRELHDVPLVLAHTAPISFRSLHRMAKTEVMPIGDRAPRWVKSGWLRMVDWLADRALGPEFKEIRRELGLEPVKRVFKDWMVYSPDVTIGLFPEWFAPRQPDWPTSLRLTGFPLWDSNENATLNDGLGRWLAGGTAPVLFTAGSANVQAEEFFETALSSCSELGLRALFVNPKIENMPAQLPEWARHESFVPFSLVLAECRALVSHGGIGTCAQGLAAGIPHLVTHINFDQRDNGSRLRDLGAGAAIPVRKFRDRNAISAIESVLDQRLDERAEKLANRVDPSAARERAASLIEAAAGPQ